MPSEHAGSSLTVMNNIESPERVATSVFVEESNDPLSYNSICSTNPSPSNYSSSAPSLSCLNREVRYARAEAALRLALSQCDSEPSPLELQIRVMERGLRAWNARAGLGYERVRKAEEALAVARTELTRGSLSELQREKWMGIKERDEALEMVEKIKELIAQLDAELKQSKMSPKSMVAEPLSPPKSAARERPTSPDADSTKAPMIFSGRLPSHYLQNLPRSRSSVEPLRLTQTLSRYPDVGGRPRSTTLRSEPVTHPPSTPSISRPSTPSPRTPIDEFGAAFIYTPLPPKSPTQYLADNENLEGSVSGSRHPFGHTRLPSYVNNLLDELSEDRIESSSFSLNKFEVTLQSPPRTSLPEQQALSSPAPTLSDSKARSRAFLGRPFSTPSSVLSTPSSRSREQDHLTSAAGHQHLDPGLAFEKLLHAFSSTTSTPSESTSAPGTPVLAASDLTPALQLGKGQGRMGNIVQSVRKGVKKVVRMGD